MKKKGIGTYSGRFVWRVLQVQHFDTPEEVDTWLLANPMRCYGTLYFEEQGTSAIAYGVQTNSTAIFFHGRFSDPNFSYQIPLQVAAEREIARTVLGGRAHYAHWPSLFSTVQEDVIRFPHLMMASEEFIPPKFCSEKNWNGKAFEYVCNMSSEYVCLFLILMVQIPACCGILLSLSLPIQPSAQTPLSEQSGRLSCWQQLCLVLWFKSAILCWRRRWGWDRWETRWFCFFFLP